MTVFYLENGRCRWRLGLLLALLAACCGVTKGLAQDGVTPVVDAATTAIESPDELLERFNAYPHAELIDSSSASVIDYEIGLGAIQKTRGDWRLKDSERLSGELRTYTWQIIDGFTSSEVARELSDVVEQREQTQLLFSCKGRACGPGVQWANRVFKQRLLYGLESTQQYRVYALDEATGYRLVIYNSARTSDRQYMHVELLRIEG
jgi:hypothetical protein